MVRYLGPRVRIIQRLGLLPGLTRKQQRKEPGTGKIPLPGQHGYKYNRKRDKIYSTRLLEKQKLRFNYGLTEKQLQKYVRKARRTKGSTAFFLMQYLELRLDTLVFRAGLAPTMPAARQLVTHGHIVVNGHKVTIPSFQCRPKDIFSIRNRPQSVKLAKKGLEEQQYVKIPKHLVVNKNTLTVDVMSLVDKKEFTFDVKELLIIEYYSRIL